MSCTPSCLFPCLFFIKQKTAYEMRISDWSSDVCSSDLDRAVGPVGVASGGHPADHLAVVPDGLVAHHFGIIGVDDEGDEAQLGARLLLLQHGVAADEGVLQIGRASCRERCVSTCRSRWSPSH